MRLAVLLLFISGNVWAAPPSDADSLALARSWLGTLKSGKLADVQAHLGRPLSLGLVNASGRPCDKWDDAGKFAEIADADREAAADCLVLNVQPRPDNEKLAVKPWKKLASRLPRAARKQIEPAAKELTFVTIESKPTSADPWQVVVIAGISAGDKPAVTWVWLRVIEPSMDGE